MKLAAIRRTLVGLFLSSLFLIGSIFVAESAVDAAEPIPLRAGPLTMLFDADNAFLRYVKVGEHEVLRGVYAPIRDGAWGTVRPNVSNVQVDNGGDHFRVTFDATCSERDIDFRWRGTIVGTRDGEVEFAFDGVADSTFLRNRIGLCILHGPSAAGKPWIIQHANGQEAKGHFPTYISPHQPAKDLRAISHQVAGKLWAHVEMEGDVFEMEDQRNWTDASFKMYCTPLELPYPVEVAKGTKISQKVKISLSGELPHEPQSGTDGVVLTLSGDDSELPRLGVQVSSEVVALTDAQLDRLKALHLDHLRVNLAISNKSFVDDLRRATKQAKALGVSLQIGLTLGESPDFPTLLSELKQLQPPVSYWLVTGGKPADFQDARRQLAPVLGEAKIGVTRITNFVDLNRERPEDKSIEAVGFAITPQIHAFDNASMIETLPIHRDVVNSTKQFLPDRPLVVGPITLRPQWIDGKAPLGGPPAGPLPSYVDARQVEPFAAAWMLGSLKYLAESGVQSATYFETVGWTGIMDADDVASRPAAFPSRPGEVFPIYHLLREIGEFAGGRVRRIDSSNELGAVGLALRVPGRTRVLVGNLTGEPRTVALRGLSGKPVAVQVLGGKATEAKSELRISLPPYGIARVDQIDSQKD
ncbi:MAG: hypothetical protein WD875_09365 [Pirellulales bacterium]